MSNNKKRNNDSINKSQKKNNIKKKSKLKTSKKKNKTIVKNSKMSSPKSNHNNGYRPKRWKTNTGIKAPKRFYGRKYYNDRYSPIITDD